MELRVVALLAESHLLRPLRAAAQTALGQELRLSLHAVAAEELARPEVAQAFKQAAQTAHIVLGSMVNTEAEATQAVGLLSDSPAPIRLFFNCEPELASLTHLEGFDAARYTDRVALGQLAAQLREAGVPLPPLLHVILAAAPRVAPLLPADRFPGLVAYGRVAQYWLHASEENFRRLFEYLAPMALPQAVHAGSGKAADRAPGTQVLPPEAYPAVALWHPAAGQYFADTDAYLTWYRTHVPDCDTRPWVGVILFRQYVTSGNSGHYAQVIAHLEAAGLSVIGGFATLDNTPLLERYFQPMGIDLCLNLTGFNLVGSMGQPRPEQAVALLKRLDTPYLVAVPLLFQSIDQWEADRLGLAPTQVALQVVMPELEGGTEPRVFGGRGHDDRFVSIEAQAARLARRVARLVTLRQKPAAKRRVAITVFSFPPDKGAIGTAAYLDVFRSLYHFLENLQAAGYHVDMPASPDALRQMLLGELSPHEGGRAAIADRLSVRRYKEIFPDWRRLAPVWGEPPGNIDTDGRHLLIHGVALGNVFIGVQPSFGYEGDPMRLLFAPDASPSHSFAAFYAWLDRQWEADAVVHFGTHGALEFMPGKQVGLGPACYPDLLIGDLPHVYFYSINNPSEATIAKRRSYAHIVTYLSPPLSAAGLYRQLSAVQEALTAWRNAAGSARRAAAWQTLTELVTECSLHVDVPLPEPSPHGDEDRHAAYVQKLDAYLTDLGTRLIPVGLHVAGEPPSAEQAETILWAEAQFARPEHDTPSLLALCQKVAAEPSSPETLARQVIRALVTDGEAAARAALAAAAATNGAVGEAPFAADGEGAWERAWERWVTHATDVLTRLRSGDELGALTHALGGGYIPPSPGGDPVREPMVLPSGRNMHALDPYRIPSPVARRMAEATVKELLARLEAEQGRLPESIGLVLWGTDNIKTHGEGVAQALALLGVEPVEDSLGRLTRLRLIPLEKLGRPRIDVVLTTSGIFRDIFPNTMELLDQAVRLAATADEPEELNFVKKRTRSLAKRLGLNEALAATRLFSNAPGHYGTGVNHLVESSDWSSRDELGDVYLARKSFAYGQAVKASGAPDAPQRHPGAAMQTLLEACLADVGALFQNLDSTEIGLADVDHYYEYLGGLSAAAAKARQNTGQKAQAIPAYIADAVTPGTPVRSLAETIRLETRTRLLNPRWYEGMLAHGYQGVNEIAMRTEHTFGWSATADVVDAWVYQSIANTYVLDEPMRNRLAELNAQAARRMAGRLLEAAERGFWSPSAAQLDALHEALADLEDRVEGVA